MKTIIASAIIAAASLGFAASSASAGGYGYGGHSYRAPTTYYAPTYKTVCTPIFAQKTISVYNSYTYSYDYKTITVKVGQDCHQVLVY